MIEARTLRLALAGLITASVGASPAFAVTAATQTLPTPPAPIAGVSVPKPHLRPKGSGQSLPGVRPAATITTAPPTNTTTAAATTPATVTAPAKVPATPGFTVNPNSKFTAEQQLDLARITSYFNSFRTMEGKFVQVGPSGEQSQGTFNLSRPGNIRFHYDPPSKLDVIADGRSVAIRDGSTATQDIYPLSKTPLRYLLAEQVDLTSDKLVDSIREDPDLISVLIIEKTAFVDGKLVLIFDRKSFQLKQWIVTDAQGLNTSVAIYSVTTDRPQDPKQFFISSSF